MNTGTISDVRDDLHHVEHLLKALRIMADSNYVTTEVTCGLTEVINVALSALDVADGRLAAMQGSALESEGGANLHECVA